MSTLSAQVDELNKLAGDGSIEWVAGPIRASLLRDVADTLDESAKLHEELEVVGTAAYLYGRGDLPRLPHFWTHDGTLHIEPPKLPKGIIVTLPDERDREVHTARVWRYVQERVTTRHGKFKTKYGRKVPLCECCGYSIGDDRYHFCPNCGARVVD